MINTHEEIIGAILDTAEKFTERRMRDARQAAELLESPARMKLSLAEGLIGAYHR